MTSFVVKVVNNFELFMGKFRINFSRGTFAFWSPEIHNDFLEYLVGNNYP